MDLTNISVIKAILARHGFSFKKSLGQNFLIDPRVCPRMVEESNIDKDTAVIEIGPGIGVLTAELCKRAGRVAAVEIDSRLIPILNETLAEFDNYEIINDDILKIDLQRLAAGFGGMRVAVCANLPYYITNPVIMKLVEGNANIDSITLMVQREAAERITAPPATRNVGVISMAVRLYSEPEILFRVKPGSFFPPPKVDSAVIMLRMRERPLEYIRDRDFFMKFVKAAFSQRRKTLQNSLAAGLGVNKEKLVNILDSLEISPMARPEELSMEQLASVCDMLASDD